MAYSLVYGGIVTILGIDPGPVTSHWALFDGISAHAGSGLNSDWGGFYLPENVAIEKVASYGMSVGADVFETCFWSGRLCERYSVQKCRIMRPTRKEIVVHVCGSAKAKDSNVRQALIDRLGAPGKKKAPGPTYGIKGDQWQALAVAVYAYDKLCT